MTQENVSMSNILVQKADLKDLMKLKRFFDSEFFDFSSEDAQINLRAKTDQVFLAKTCESGEILGQICASKIGDKNAFISPCFVAKGQNSSEIAKKLRIQAEKFLEGRNILSKRGSPIIEETSSCFAIQRYSGIPNIKDFQAPLRSGYGIHICHAQMVPEDDLVNFDQKIVGSDRRFWIRHFLNHSNANCYPEVPWSVSLVVTRTSGPISAWGTIRPGPTDAYKLGPLYAEDENSARLLLRALIDSSPGAQKFGLECQVLSDHSKGSLLMKEVGLARKPDGNITLVANSENKFHFIKYDSVYALSNFETQYI